MLRTRRCFALYHPRSFAWCIRRVQRNTLAVYTEAFSTTTRSRSSCRLENLSVLATTPICREKVLRMRSRYSRLYRVRPSVNVRRTSATDVSPARSIPSPSGRAVFCVTWTTIEQREGGSFRPDHLARAQPEINRPLQTLREFRNPPEYGCAHIQRLERPMFPWV